jgi:membrane-associated PAP2 superfamily phosphatase
VAKLRVFVITKEGMNLTTGDSSRGSHFIKHTIFTGTMAEVFKLGKYWEAVAEN